MTKLLLFLGTLLAAILIALFTVPAMIDWNNYRNTFEKEAGRLIGREVRVGGNVSLRLLPVPYVNIENVRIADEKGGFGTAFLRVKGFTLWLAIAPLMGGTIEARQVELNEPELRLAVGADGRGNWVGLGKGEASLPFIPADVAFNSVAIRGGIVSFHSANDEELLRLSDVSGEISAPSLAGPYRFRGEASQAGQKQSIRLSTGTLDDPAGLRLKVIVEAQGANRSYDIDGVLSGLDTTPTLNGALTARFTMPAAASSAEGEAGEPVVMELASALEADPRGLQLKDVNLTFETGGHPQVVTGQAVADWGERLRIDARLQARWLDLDSVLSPGQTVAPLPEVERLAGAIGDLFGDGTRARLVAQVEQIQLGGAPVSGIRLELEHDAQHLAVRALEARLPGNSALVLSGRLERAHEGIRFAGPVQLRGMSLVKLLDWLSPLHRLGEGGVDGLYLLSADLAWNSSEVVADNLLLELQGSAARGHIRYGLTEPSMLEAAINSDHLDLRTLTGEVPTLTRLVKLLVGRGQATAADGAASSDAGAPLDTDVRLEIGRLDMGTHTVRDVAADFRLSGDKLTIDRLAFLGDNGLALEAAGEVRKLGPSPEGSIQISLDADSRPAAAAMARFVELPENSALYTVIERSLAPMRLAVTLDMGEASAGTLALRADGQAGSGRLSIEGRFEGELDAPAGGHVDLTATLSDSDGMRLLQQLFGRKELPAAVPAAQAESAPGSASIRLSGVPQTGMSAVLAVQSAALSGALEGAVRYAEGDLTIDGTGQLDVTSTALAFDLAGFDRLKPAEDGPVSVRTRLAYAQGRWLLNDLDFQLAGSQLSGKASIERGQSVTRLTFDGRSDRIGLEGLLGLALARASVTSEAEAALDGSASIWSDRPFDFGAFAGLEGDIALTAERIDVSNGLALDDAQLRFRLAPDRLQLERIEGSLLGGRAHARGALVREAAGAALTLEVGLDQARLEQFVSQETGQPRASGSMTLAAKAEGRGLSPRGLLAVLQGTGSLDVGEGRLEGLSPDTIETVARAVLVDNAKLNAENLQRLIAKERLSGSFPLSGAQMRLTIADGAVRSNEAVFEGDRASLAIRSVLDLASLRIDSEWSLRPRASEPGADPLPPVTLIYAGPLKGLAELEPQIDAGALERELTARRILGGEGLQGLIPPQKEGNAGQARDDAGLKAAEAGAASAVAGDALEMAAAPEPTEVIPFASADDGAAPVPAAEPTVAAEPTGSKKATRSTTTTKPKSIAPKTTVVVPSEPFGGRRSLR